jgi:hypothetical protein
MVDGWTNSRLVRDHLTEAHYGDLADLTDAELESKSLFVCRECDNKLFVTSTTLNNTLEANIMST